MDIKDFLNNANDFANKLEMYTEVMTPESILKSNSDDYKKLKKICLTIILAVPILCIGIMYLRFKVWG